MRNAERAVLFFLHKTNHPISRMKLVKLFFLLQKDSNLLPNESLYDFLPHKYGPFSFTLYHNISKLIGNGWAYGEKLQLPENKSDAALCEIRQLPEKLKWALIDIWSRYSEYSDHHLLKMVYEKYPMYAFRSKLSEFKTKSPKSTIGIYTIGYEGATIDAFLNSLLQKGISRIIDIRSNPISRKWGFSKSILSSFCQKLEIDYVHIPELGIESNKRKNLDSYIDYINLLDNYEQSFLPQIPELIDKVSEFIKEKSSVLLCMEADYSKCHRCRLAKKLNQQMGLPVQHLTHKYA